MSLRTAKENIFVGKHFSQMKTKQNSASRTKRMTWKKTVDVDGRMHNIDGHMEERERERYFVFTHCVLQYTKAEFIQTCTHLRFSELHVKTVRRHWFNLKAHSFEVAKEKSSGPAASLLFGLHSGSLTSYIKHQDCWKMFFCTFVLFRFLE